MDIYKKKSNWKIYLGVAGVIIVLISMLYTNYLADRLAQGEKDKVELLALTMKQLSDIGDLDKDIGFEQRVLKIVSDVPVITVGEDGEITGSRNFEENSNLEHELEHLRQEGLPPVEGHGYASEIYFKHTRLLTLLTYFPFVQMLLLLAFVAIGYFGFSAARKAEQNQVWVGMAKETAHQLGTPISAIVAWIEFLKDQNSDNPAQLEVLGELTNDVDRLELIADRFSKIGSAPALKEANLISTLDNVRNYMSKRASKKIIFDFPALTEQFMVKINSHLFIWVAENLLRNSLDAMDGTGTIKAEVYKDDQFTYVDFSDTGKGIPKDMFKTVFQPGYSTKKRGWGLGLSLAQRIIENYHQGRIFVKKSTLDEGSTFTIALPNA